jgi:hypothetical protein
MGELIAIMLFLAALAALAFANIAGIRRSERRGISERETEEDRRDRTAA